MKRKMELLSPAGTPEKLKMAFRYGADAVYLAGKAFGLRAFGGNFSREELKEAVIYAHRLGKKIYVTVNIIPSNEDLEGLADYLTFLSNISVDAVLISDLGVFALCREAAPTLSIHISTQASAANWRAVKMWKDLGAERVVLARESSLEDIREIHRHVDMELEAFGHGAMCISWSGRCLLSDYFTEGKRRSNRGECIQACRFKYAVTEESRPGQYFPIEEDEHGTYIFNSKDLCMIDYIPALTEAGVSSLKIEGRMKSVYYVAAVTAVYRQAIDAYEREGSRFFVRPEWRTELEKVSHRPYTAGFALSRPEQAYDLSQPEQPYDFIGLVLSYDRKKGAATIQQRNFFRAGETVECLSPKGDVFSLSVGELRNGEGDVVLSASHPMETLTMKTDRPLLSDSVLRRKHHG